MTLSDIFTPLADNCRWILLVMAVGLAIGIASGASQPKLYQADSVVAFKTTDEALRNFGYDLSVETVEKLRVLVYSQAFRQETLALDNGLMAWYGQWEEQKQKEEWRERVSLGAVPGSGLAKVTVRHETMEGAILLNGLLVQQLDWQGPTALGYPYVKIAVIDQPMVREDNLALQWVRRLSLSLLGGFGLGVMTVLLVTIKPRLTEEQSA
ncbi:MAG: hypothetical protein V1707_02825 [bacterium]